MRKISFPRSFGYDCVHGPESPSDDAVDVMNVPQISDPQVSFNGREILYVRSEPDWKAKSPHRPHLENELRRIECDPDDRRNRRREHPAVVAGREDNRVYRQARHRTRSGRQVLLIPTVGGEARALTSHATAVTNIGWDPIEGAVADWEAGVLRSGKGMRDEPDGLDERRRDSVAMRRQPAIGDSGDASTFRAWPGRESGLPGQSGSGIQILTNSWR